MMHLLEEQKHTISLPTQKILKNDLEKKSFISPPLRYTHKKNTCQKEMLKWTETVTISSFLSSGNTERNNTKTGHCYLGTNIPYQVYIERSIDDHRFQ